MKAAPQRVQPLVVALLVVLLCATASPSQGQQNFDTIQVRRTPVAGNVHMLVGAGGNIGLMVGDDAVFVVDDQFAPLTPKLLAAIKEVTPQPVRFVLNTHWHGDHTGGNDTHRVRRRVAIALCASRG
jgi:glyoxylase-like metal-dependent hydrolase (beta-lactamase superfamily II)